MLFVIPFLHGIFNFLMYTILPFVFILGFCVTIHEFGHFIFAKLFHIPVEKFSIGFGPPLFRKQIGETDFRIAYFPLGGYVKMVGEEEGEILKHENTTTPESTQPGFYDAPIYKKVLVVFAGPLFNIISAFIVLFLITVIFGIAVDPYITVHVDKGSYADIAGFLDGDSIISVDNTAINNWDEFVKLASNNLNKEVTITIMRSNREISKKVFVHPDSLGLTNVVPPVLGIVKKGGPAYEAGMKDGDRVLKIDGINVQTWHEMVDIVRNSKGTSLLFEWEHEGEIKSTSIKPLSNYDYLAKDTVRQIAVLRPYTRTYYSLLGTFAFSIKQIGVMIVRTLEIFYQLISREIPVKAIGGPVAIFKLSVESLQWGLEYLLLMLIIISVNLGLINLFPLPALDGGHILIFLIETVRRKRFSKRTRLIIQQIGYALILLLIIFITFNDITR
jgi:regulator of sigma E protease